MPSDRFRLGVIGLVVGTLLVISVGVGPAPTSGEPDPDDLVEEAVDSMNNEPIEAVRTMEINQQGTDIKQTVAVQELPPQYVRIEVLDASTEANQDVVRVVNDEAAWRYLRDEGIAVRYEDSTWLDESQSVGTAPNRVIERYDSKYRGTTEYHGREVYVVELTPPESTEATLSLDINAGDIDEEISLYEATAETWYVSQEIWWIDAETHYPVKKHVQWTDASGTVVATATQQYRKLTVGADIETDVFDFQPEPDNETDENPTAVVDTAVYNTRNATDAAVPFDVPDPDLPTGYEFERATVHSREGDHTVLLRYRLGSSSVWVDVSPHQSAVPGDPAVQIAQRRLSKFDGHVAITDNGAAVVRDCEELTVRVRGLVNADRLIDIADSLDC